MAATAGAVCLEGNDELHVHPRELHRESRDSGCELCDGGAVTCCGRLQVCDGVHRLLLETPAVRVYGGVVRGTVRGTRLIFNRVTPLPVGGGEKHSEMGERFSSADRLLHS